MVFEQKSGHPPGMNKRVYNSVNDEINDQPQLLQDFGNVIRPWRSFGKAFQFGQNGSVHLLFAMLVDDTSNMFTSKRAS